MEKTPLAKRGGIHHLSYGKVLLYLSLMKYFSIVEFLRSDAAEKYQVSNIPSDEELLAVLTNINALVDNVLDPLRSMIGRPFIITSGYRSQRVNELIGGSKTSAPDGKGSRYSCSGIHAPTNGYSIPHDSNVLRLRPAYILPLKEYHSRKLERQKEPSGIVGKKVA